MVLPKAGPDTQEEIRRSASKVIELGSRRFGITLDFSEESLVILDDLITLFFKERKSHYITAATFIGSFLGEAITGNLGGKWLTDLSIKKVGKLKMYAHPMQRARKRLENGMSDSLAFYYRSLKLSSNQDATFAADNGRISEAYGTLCAKGWDLKLLTRVLNDGEKKYVREEAADLLGRLGSRRMGEPLITALRNQRTAYYAAIALQGVKDPAALEPLLDVLHKTRSPAVKMQAALALGELNNPVAVDSLARLLSDENEIVCHYASMALRKIRSEKTLSVLLDILDGKLRGNRVYAIAALEGMEDMRAVPVLIESLFSRDEELREAAARALQYLPDERAFKPLLYLLKDHSSRIRILAGYALANQKNSEVLTQLKGLLKDEVQTVRLHAARLVSWLEAGEQPARCI
jgi:HEAT repeat protein